MWNAAVPMADGIDKKKEKRLSSRQLHKIISARMQREVGCSPTMMAKCAHTVSVLVRGPLH